MASERLMSLEKEKKKYCDYASHLRTVNKTVLGHVHYPLDRNVYFARPRTCYLYGSPTTGLSWCFYCILFIYCFLRAKPKRYCLEIHQQGSAFPANLQLPDRQTVIPCFMTEVSTLLAQYATLLSHGCCGQHRKSVF